MRAMVSFAGENMKHDRESAVNGAAVIVKRPIDPLGPLSFRDRRR